MITRDRCGGNKIVWKMHTKILLVCILCTMVALILQTLLFRSTSSKLIYEQSKEESFNSLQNMQDDIYSFIKKIETNAIGVYSDKEFISALKHETDVEALRTDYYREAYTLATENFETQDDVLALYLYNADDEIISTYRRATTPKHNYPEDIYADGEADNAKVVKDYVDSNQTVMLISSYYNTARETDILRFVLKIYSNSNTEQKIGYLVCDVDTKVLQYMMKKYFVSDDMFLWLQPMGDRPVFSMGELSGRAQESYQSLADSVAAGSTEDTLEYSGGNQIIFQVDQSRYNLVAFSVMPQALLRASQKTLTRNLLMIAIVMLVIALVFSTIVSRTITWPLERLTDVTKRIKNGETDLRIEPMKLDEIGELGLSFNEMLDQIQELVSRQYETKLLLNKAEYNALQAQINPHFLYNTLDTMSSIAQIKNCEEVSALSQSLSNIFRYSLDMRNPLSTVSKEIVHLKNYIYVMDVRMGSSITYTYSIDEQVLNDSIPRLSIQPIVENAINHGLKNARGERRIDIVAYRQQEQLMITVMDNGVGIPADKLGTLLNEADQDEKQSTSIGLYNINERLKMLYGEAYGLRITSKEGEGTTVTLCIPDKPVWEA